MWQQFVTAKQIEDKHNRRPVALQRSKDHNSLINIFLKLSPAPRSREMGRIILISHPHVKEKEENTPI